MENILKIENIEKYYGSKSSLTKAIDNISFEVEKGIVIAERSRDIKTEKDKIKYWRTASKQEVDFIVNSKSLYAIEVKLRGTGKSNSGLKSFIAKYESAKPVIITLEKTGLIINPNYKYLYPWEINHLFI